MIFSRFTRGMVAAVTVATVLCISDARAQETPPGCTFAGAGAAITRFPNTSVNHGDKICYTVQYNNGSEGVNCQLENFDADLFLPDGSVVPLLNDATIPSGGIVICPSADPRCITPSNCTIAGQIGYEYIVDHADEVANFNACPPTFTPGSGRIVAYTYGEGDSLTTPPDFANACATANNFVTHGSCCEPCTGVCTPAATCNECPGDSIFTVGGDCSASCLLTCGDQDACTTDGVCIPGSGRDNCSATPGGTPATCGANVHFCDAPPPGFTCNDGNACTTDTCLDDTNTSNPCCSNVPITCPPQPCMRSTGCNPITGCQYTFDCREPAAPGEVCCPADSDSCDTESCNQQTGLCEASPLCDKGEICCAEGVSCDDGDACTEDICAEGCCVHRDIDPCCGDGEVTPPETCDDGNTNNNDDCRNDCTFCGDSVVNGGEMCDDGNTNNNDDCSNNCTNGCGNGIVNTGEYCDDGNTNNDDGCRNDCTACGDGIVNGGEECDDGNDVDTDECSNTCVAQGFDGCTPGFWKQPHHLQYWVGYLPTDLYDTVFGVTSTFGANTLLEVLQQGGGGEIALGRHAVAALLNSTNDDVDFAFTTAEVIAMVQEAYETGDFSAAHTRLAAENERGCTVVKSGGKGDRKGGSGRP